MGVKTMPRPAPRKRVIIPLVAFGIAAIAGFIYWYDYERGYVSTKDAFIDGDPVTVSSKILGRITQIAADMGDTTRAGQVVVWLDQTTLRAEEVQAEAALAYTRDAVSLAKISLDRALDDFKRAQVQYRDSVITREQFDHARQALEMARAQHNVALSQVKTSEAQLGVVETQLSGTEIVSPISGVVAKRWAMPGEVVQPGQSILTLYDLSDVWVTANFEETKLARIVPNDQVQISVDAYPGRTFSGHVLLVGAAAASEFSLIPPNNASGNFTKVTQRVPVKILLDDRNPSPATSADAVSAPAEGGAESSPQALLLPGMSTVVKIKVK
jgi:membrane fusion protein (multidrug efflux system)